MDTVRLYLEATVAVAVMAMLGIISGFATVALTGDGRQAFFVAAVAFVLTAIVLTVRLWRMTKNADRFRGAAGLTRRTAAARLACVLFDVPPCSLIVRRPG